MVYANSADPDQTAQGEVWSSLHCFPFNPVIEMNKMFEILGHLLYFLCVNKHSSNTNKTIIIIIY